MISIELFLRTEYLFKTIRVLFLNKSSRLKCQKAIFGINIFIKLWNYNRISDGNNYSMQ